MRVIVEMPEYLVKQIRNLIEEGRYKDVSSFIMTSSDNQLAIESEDTSHILEREPRYGQNFELTNEDLSLLAFDNTKKLQLVDAPKESDLAIFNKEKGKEEWIWGQINRILPIKFTLRLLINLIPIKENSINLDDFSIKACSLARRFGECLLQKDNENGRKRSEKLSVGFPIGKNEEKALSRYSSQFIGYKMQDNRLVGALSSLRFANIYKDNLKYNIGITKEGYEFGKLENPNFDSKLYEKAFTQKEVDFYLRHIKKNVYSEYEAFRNILDIIQSGIVERESVNNELSKKVGRFFEWSDDLLNTQRTGAMSRLYELGLICKTKRGIYVEYNITKRGIDFLLMK